MLSAYPACFIKDKNGYAVIFPDLNELATCGDTLEEAFEMAVDCLAGYIYSSLQDHEVIPAPSSLQDININRIIADLETTPSEAFIRIISVNVAEYAKTHF